MANETVKVSILQKALGAADSDDPGIPADVAVRLLAKALKTLCDKLDLDAGVTDADYQATVEAVSYP